MEKFRQSITFEDGVDHGMRAGYRLSNWPEGTWEVADGLMCGRRSRVDELNVRLAYRREHYGDGPSWIKIPRAPYPALVIGDTSWHDCNVTTAVRVDAGGRAGLAVRWQDGRHCYYFLLEGGSHVAFYRRDQAELVELARQPFEHSPEEFYSLAVSVQGGTFACAVTGGPSFVVTDDHYPTGGVALLAESPAAYQHLAISGTREPARPRELPANVAPVKQLTIPLPAFDADTAIRPMLLQLNGEPLFGFRPNEGRELLFVSHEGKELFRAEPWGDAQEIVGDVPVQVFDLNGDGEDEVVLIADGHIRVFSTTTGEQLAEVDAPPPHAYGECAADPEWATVNDALCPVRLNGQDEMGFYIKDRYWNIHLYDSSLNHLWHRPVNTGHYPLPVDVDGDGRQEIMCCHTLFDVAGNVIWKADLSDHVDGHALVSLAGVDDPAPLFYMIAGEEGVVAVDPASGRVVHQFKLGHAQHALIGQFLPGPARQLLVETLWCENNIHYVLDDQLRELARWELDLGDTGVGPYVLPWGERDLVATSKGILDPLTGELFAGAAPWGEQEETPKGQAELQGSAGKPDLLGQWVMDYPGAGPSRLVQLFADRIEVWQPGDGQVRRASPLPTFFSGYLPR